MENKFQVLEQTKPTRCEVCHQTDQFDPVTATCYRCQTLIITHSLPEQEAERYRRRQEAGLTAPRDTTVPLNDLFKIIPEAIKLSMRNYKLFFLISLTCVAPAIIFGIVPRLAPFIFVDTPQIALPLSLLVWLVTLLVQAIGQGALIKAMIDRYRGEPASVVESYKFILQRGWPFIATSAINSAFIMLGVLLCLVGSLITFPLALFMPEIAIVEGSYNLDCLKRSIKLGTVNIGMLILFCLLWMGATAVIGAVSAFFVTIVSSFVALTGFSALLFPLVSIVQLVSGLVSATLLPFFFTTKLLLYFHVRMRTEEVKFTPEMVKKTQLPTAGYPANS